MAQSANHTQRNMAHTANRVVSTVAFETKNLSSGNKSASKKSEHTRAFETKNLSSGNNIVSENVSYQTHTNPPPPTRNQQSDAQI
ncbi:hypothetical protein ES703_38953 [subsurface metagenome]